VRRREEEGAHLSEVGEVSSLVTESRSSNGDGLISRSGRVVAGVSVVISSGDLGEERRERRSSRSDTCRRLRRSDRNETHGEVKSRVDGSIDGLIESRRLSSSKRHGGDGSLVRGLSSGEELSSGGGSFLGGRLSGVEDTG